MQARDTLGLLFALVLSGGCEDADRRSDCPTGETCSSKTPYGLVFGGTSTLDMRVVGLLPLAVGGTQDIHVLTYLRGHEVSFALPYRAEGGSRVVVDSPEGEAVTVRGVAVGTDQLRIVDPSTGELFDRVTVNVRALDSIGLVFYAGENPSTPDIGVVLAPGEQTFGVALRSALDTEGVRGRLIDTSMSLELAGAQRVGWDGLRLPAATIGTSTLTVTTGGISHTLPLEVVASADAIVLATTSPHLTAGRESRLCFEARNAGRFVGGLRDWMFTADGGTIRALSPSSVCAVITPTTSDNVRVHVSAGGASLDVDLAVNTFATGRVLAD